MILGLAGALCASLVAAGCSNDDDGESVIGVGENGPGTCLDVPPDQGPEIDKLPVIDCGEPHSHEIYSVPLVDEDVYPGFEALESFAQAACLRDFEPYVGISAFDSELFYSWIVPTLTSWDREDDREVLCVVGDRTGSPLVGTVRNSQL